MVGNCFTLIPILVMEYYIHTHTCLTALFRTTRVSRYQKGKTNLDFTEARDSDWQWHQLFHGVLISKKIKKLLL